jgi:hypothetical protein
VSFMSLVNRLYFEGLRASCQRRPGTDGRADKSFRATRVVVGFREHGAASEQQVPLRLRRFGMTKLN